MKRICKFKSLLIAKTNIILSFFIILHQLSRSIFLNAFSLPSFPTKLRLKCLGTKSLHSIRCEKNDIG